MATSFETIRNFIRVALMDYDSTAYIYSDDILDGQIRLTILDEALSLTESPSGQFTTDLTNTEKLVIALRSALRMLHATPNNFSYTGPVMSVRRVGGVDGLILQLEDMLELAEGGKFAIQVDTDFDALVQNFNRFINAFATADRAWTGISSS